MVMRPLLRYGALYALVEVLAVALLIWTLGLGWTLVLLAATFMVGVVLAASQVKGQFVAVRRAGSIRVGSNPETVSYTHLTPVSYTHLTLPTILLV